MAGIRIPFVHAVDDRAKAWCRQFDSEESPTDPLQLILLLDDLRHHLGAAPKTDDQGEMLDARPCAQRARLVVRQATRVRLAGRHFRSAHGRQDGL